MGIKIANTNYGTFIGYILDKLEIDDNSELYEEMNPFEMLNITSEQYEKKKKKN